MNCDKSLIAEGLRLFLDPDDVCEIRVLGASRKLECTVAGYLHASKIDQYAGAIARIADAVADGGGGAYFTPQKLKPDVLARSPHFFPEVTRRDGKVTPKLTCDDDVLSRRYLLIDIDPVREVGFEKHSATDEEKLEAELVGDSVTTHFASWGWRPPIEIDSGNGFHLYYRIPHTNQTEASTASFQVILRLMANCLDTPGAKIDTAVYNPSRIMKIPGTIARKGTHTAARPHRLCKVLEVPNDWT